MQTDSGPTPFQQQKVALPIFVGGLAAGTLDAASAVISFGWGMPRGIASGLLGRKAFDGGAATWTLGLALHYFIAFSAAAVYCLSSKRLAFLRTHFLICGLFYGVAVYLVMNLVVLPLSAFPLPVGPFTVSALTHGILAHMVLIGLPISLSLRLCSK